MINVTVKLDSPDPDQFGTSYERALITTIQLISAFAQRWAKIFAPVNTSLLRNSIVLAPITRTPTNALQGGIITNVAHALVMEDGRRPGTFPPVDAMRRWVFLKRGALGISVKQVNSVAFLIGRSISKKGIKGRKYFEAARKKTQAELGQFNSGLFQLILRAWQGA